MKNEYDRTLDILGLQNNTLYADNDLNHEGEEYRSVLIADSPYEMEQREVSLVLQILIESRLQV